MAAEEIVHPAPMKPFPAPAKLRAAPRAGVANALVAQGLRPSALGPDAEHGDGVDPAGGYRPIAADGFEALASKHLTRPGDVLDSGEPVAIRFLRVDRRLHERRPRHTQSG